MLIQDLHFPIFGAYTVTMLRLSSRRALKAQALCSPFCNPALNPLRGALQACHLHNEPAPFSGPPSYATLAQRFSAANPNPIRFFRSEERRVGKECRSRWSL